MNFKDPNLYWILFNVVFIIICPAAIPFLNGVNKLF